MKCAYCGNGKKISLEPEDSERVEAIRARLNEEQGPLLGSGTYAASAYRSDVRFLLSLLEFYATD